MKKTKRSQKGLLLTVEKVRDLRPVKESGLAQVGGGTGRDEPDGDSYCSFTSNRSHHE